MLSGPLTLSKSQGHEGDLKPKEAGLGLSSGRPLCSDLLSSCESQCDRPRAKF